MENLIPPVCPAVAEVTKFLQAGASLIPVRLNWSVVELNTPFPLTHVRSFLYSIFCAHACVPLLLGLQVVRRRGNRDNLLATFVCRRTTLMVEQS